MGFRGGKLAMADIARCGKLAIAAQLYFWQRRRYAHARSLRDGVNFAPDEPIRRTQLFRWPRPTSRILLDRGPKLSERHVFTLTGIYEGRKATSRKQPRRAAGRLTSASRRGSPTQGSFIINNFFYNGPCIQKRA